MSAARLFTSRSLLWPLGAGVLLLCAAACAPAEAELTEAPPPINAATFTTAGGALSAGTTDLLVPAGAIAGDQEVEVELAEVVGVPVPLPVDRERISALVKVTPHGTTFASAVRLSTLVDRKLLESDDVALFRLAHDDAAWERLDAETARLEIDVDGARVTFKTERFSYYAVTVPFTGCARAIPPPVCDAVWVDHDCDMTWERCPEGEVISYATDTACPVCVPANPQETCAQAAAGLDAMMEHTISASCANWCQVDDDCYAFRIETACSSRCYALHGGIDEEPIWSALTYADDHCGACGDDAATVTHVGQGSCQQGTCVFPDALSETPGEMWDFEIPER